MTANVVYSPFADLSPIELAGGKWRKLLLPVGNIKYRDRVLHFTKPYLERLADAFRQKAYDQTPFQLADATNSHTNDPERFRGEVTAMTVNDRGLWIEVQPTEAGHQLLQLNPNLGVSARIIEDYDRGDGEHYDAAIQHVLGTLDPRIPQMGPWEPIEASNSYGGSVLDLSNLSFEGFHDFTDAAGPTDAEIEALAEAVGNAQSDEEVDALLGMSPQEFAQRSGNGTDVGAGYNISEPEDSGDTELPDEELQALQDWAEGEDPETQEAVRHLVSAGADLSNNYDTAMELASMGMQTVDLATVLGEDQYAQIDLAAEMQQQRAAAAAEHDQAYTRQQSTWRRAAHQRGSKQLRTEDRLAFLYQRVSTGTYLPLPEYGFSSDYQRDITLTNLRESQDIGLATAVHGASASGACGMLDDFGRCAEPNHSADCYSVIDDVDYWASPDGRQALAGAAFRPDGVQYSDLLEAMTGVRGSQDDASPFLADRAERAGHVFARRPVLGDPDADERGGGIPMDDAATIAMVGQVKAAMGISSPARGTRAARQQVVEDRRAVAKLQTPMQRAGLDTSHLETSSERASRMHRTPSRNRLVAIEDGIGGALPQYSNSAF